MRYPCPYCEKKHWLRATTVICGDLWLSQRIRERRTAADLVAGRR